LLAYRDSAGGSSFEMINRNLNRSGGIMDLKESKFYYAGHDMNFAVFSDYPCRVKYVDSIPLPISQAPVEVYAIEPAADSQWIVVQQSNDGKTSLKFYLREGEIFHENESGDLPQHLKEHILQRIPKSPGSSERSWAA
jgi:hypothetical protein